MLAHSCTIFPCYLGMDNQCKDPISNIKDCRVGQLTRGWDVPGGVVWMLTGGGSCEEGGSVAASVERALTHPVFPPRVLSMFILSFVWALFTQAWRSNLFC